MSGPVLVLVGLSGESIDRSSLEAITLAAALAEAHGTVVEALIVADPAAARTAAARLGRPAVTTSIVVDHPQLTLDHPDGWAAAVAWMVEARRPVALVGAGTERGNELLARVAARLGLPLAANCSAVESVGARHRVTRQRWAGSLLEDAWLDASIALLTVAPNTVAPADLAAVAGAAGVEAVTPRPRRRGSGRPGHEPRGARARDDLAGRCERRRRRWPRCRQHRWIRGARGAGRAAGRGRRRVAGRHERRLAAARRPDRPDRAADRAGALHRQIGRAHV